MQLLQCKNTIAFYTDYLNYDDGMNYDHGPKCMYDNTMHNKQHYGNTMHNNQHDYAMQNNQRDYVVHNNEHYNDAVQNKQQYAQHRVLYDQGLQHSRFI